MLVEILMGDASYDGHRQTEACLFEVHVPGIDDPEQFKKRFDLATEESFSKLNLPRPMELFHYFEEETIECENKAEAETLLDRLNAVCHIFLIDDYPPKKGPKVFIEVGDFENFSNYAMAYAAYSIPGMTWKRVFPVSVASGLGYGFFKL